ncbi:hypothetical protein [Psychrobacter sp. I-STPA10]|uniref:hypothetical protein n=1 Tax=Psychrobacter sp. I-STPA10 TaxID=2585769 RepID=UPI001E4035AD|nr:hypothetical protein [Psychrobacter sp. I-STPA10]
MNNKNDIHEIAIVDNEGQKVFSIVKADRHIQGKKLPLNEQSFIESHLSSIVGNIPNIGKTIDSMNSYTAHFSKEAMENWKNGALELKKSGKDFLPQLQKTDTKRISEQARLKSGMTPTNIALLCWQIATVITAQQHLSNIDKKLGDLHDIIKNIEFFLVEKDCAEIQANIEYIDNLISSFYQDGEDFINELNEMHSHKIADLIKDINSSVIFHIEIMRKLESEIKSHKFNNKKNIKKSEVQINKFVENMKLLDVLLKSQINIFFLYIMCYGKTSFINSCHKKSQDNIEKYLSILDNIHYYINNELNNIIENRRLLNFFNSSYSYVFPLSSFFPVRYTMDNFVYVVDSSGIVRFDLYRDILQRSRFGENLYNIEYSRNIFKELQKDNIEDYFRLPMEIIFDIDESGDILNLRYIDINKNI